MMQNQLWASVFEAELAHREIFAALESRDNIPMLEFGSVCKTVRGGELVDGVRDGFDGSLEIDGTRPSGLVGRAWNDQASAGASLEGLPSISLFCTSAPWTS